MGKEKNNLYVKPRTFCYYNWNLNKLIKELLWVYLNVFLKKLQSETNSRIPLHIKGINNNNRSANMIFKSTVPILYPFSWYYVHLFTVIQALEFMAGEGEMAVEHPKSFTGGLWWCWWLLLSASYVFCLIAHIYTLIFLYWLACLCYMQISCINAILQMLHVCLWFSLLFLNPVFPQRSEFLQLTMADLYTHLGFSCMSVPHVS